MVQVDHDEFVRPYERERYFLVEADGKRGQFMGYQQRPAAIRNAASLGFGVYDSRERVVIEQPNVEKRLDRIHRTIAHLKQRLDDEEQLRERVLASTGQHELEVD